MSRSNISLQGKINVYSDGSPDSITPFCKSYVIKGHPLVRSLSSKVTLLVSPMSSKATLL